MNIGKYQVIHCGIKDRRGPWSDFVGTGAFVLLSLKIAGCFTGIIIFSRVSNYNQPVRSSDRLQKVRIGGIMKQILPTGGVTRWT